MDIYDLAMRSSICLPFSQPQKKKKKKKNDMTNKLHEFSTSTTNKLDSGLNQVPIIYDGRP